MLLTLYTTCNPYELRDNRIIIPDFKDEETEIYCG